MNSNLEVSWLIKLYELTFNSVFNQAATLSRLKIFKERVITLLFQTIIISDNI